VIGIATPIVLGTGEHAGILHFEIPIERFATELSSAPFGGTSYSMLLDRSGRLFAHPQLAAFRGAAGVSTDPNTGPFPLATAFGSASWRDAIGQIISDQIGMASFDEGGRTYRVSYRPVADSDRIVAVVSPVSELYADVDRALLNLAVTAGPLILLIILVTGWFARRMSRANRGLAGRTLGSPRRIRAWRRRAAAVPSWPTSRRSSTSSRSSPRSPRTTSRCQWRHWPHSMSR